MKCLYINLESAVARRERLEEAFRLCAPPSWRLERVNASVPADVAAMPGACTPVERACFASHLRAIEASLDDAHDVLIFEDDATFSARSLQLIEQVVAKSSDWDFFMTDFAIMDSEQMLLFAREWSRLARTSRFLIESLVRVRFIGATSYVVRHQAKQKLLDALGRGSIDKPFDIKLRDLLQAGTLQARFCFPFLTSVATQGDRSQISERKPRIIDGAVNAFRRLMFLDRDLGAIAEECRRLTSGLDDPHAQLCGQIFSAMISDDG